MFDFGEGEFDVLNGESLFGLGLGAATFALSIRKCQDFSTFTLDASDLTREVHGHLPL